MPLPVGVASATVLIDVAGTPFGATPVWTDVSAYVSTTGDSGQPMEGTWGRQDYLGDVTAGSATIVFDNPDGRFTPGNASSPYYPYIRRGTHLRVQMTVAGVVINIFDGYADSWEQQFENGIYGICTFNGSDLLGRYGNDNTLRTWLVEEMVLDAVATFNGGSGESFIYPLQEPEGATSFGDIAGFNNPPATIANSPYGAGVVDAGQSSAGVFIAGNVVNLTPPAYPLSPGDTTAAGSWLALPLPALSTASDFTVEMWVMVPAQPTGSDTATLLSNTSGAFTLSVGAGFVDAFFAGIDATGVLPDDGNVHQVVVTFDRSALTLTIYIDGVFAGENFPLGVPGGFGGPSTVGMDVGEGSISEPLSGGVAFLGLFPVVLSTGRILNHYQAGSAGYAGQFLTSGQIGKLLFYRPNTGSNLDPGMSHMGFQDISGESFAQALLDCGDVEGGLVYIDGQGRVNLRNRANLLNPAVDLVLDCSLLQVDIPTTFRDDNQNFRNDITVSRPGGADQRYVNAASVEQDGAAPDSITLAIDSDDSALAMAAWLVAIGSQEQLGSPALSVNLLTEPSTAIVMEALQIAPLNVVEAVNLPAGSPAGSFAGIVEGGSWTIGVEDFELSWYTTQIPPAVVEINGDAAHGINSTLAILAP